MWLDKKLIQICGRLVFWQYTLKLTIPYSYTCNFYGRKAIGYFAHLKLGVAFKVIFVAFYEFELTAEGQEHIKMTLS